MFFSKNFLIIVTCCSLVFNYFVTFTIGQEDQNPDNNYCPDSKCESLCLSSLTQKTCEINNQFIVPNASLCGCCPGCRGGVVHGECNENIKCAPGLKCINKYCYLDKSTCAYTYHLKNYQQLPTCDVDGTFAAVQCKGDKATGRCFCYSETGERIYGWAWWKDSKDMTCACSRLKHKLKLEGQYDTLHCTQNGNFEPLQCNNDICWCVNYKTGEQVPGTRAVPSVMWTFLPCYDIDKMGQIYLRQCESMTYAQYLIKKSLAIHGTTNIVFKDIKCDYDGSYGIYAISENIANCQWRDGEKIPPYAANSNLVSKMNCNCARDKKIFEESGLKHNLFCNGNGNYETLQNINGKLFCVDRDGFAVTDLFNSSDVDELSCKQYLYYEATVPRKL